MRRISRRMGGKPDKVKNIMNLKNSIYKLSFAAMIMMAMNATDLQAQGVVPAQKGEKTFTLEDLNFGGNNYRNMVAKNRWCTWWGNELVRQDVDVEADIRVRYADIWTCTLFLAEPVNNRILYLVGYEA
jgi:hypothetical protein